MNRVERALLAKEIYNAQGNPYRDPATGRYTTGGGGKPPAKPASGAPKPRPYKDATGKWVYGIPPHLRTKTDDKPEPKPRPYKDENGKWVYGIPPHLYHNDLPPEIYNYFKELLS